MIDPIDSGTVACATVDGIVVDSPASTV